jgi:hypothetical protein
MTGWRATILLAGLATAGCANATARPAQNAAENAAPVNWKRLVMPADLGRLRGWREAFVKALAAAKAGGHGDAIIQEGALLLPDSATEPVAFRGGTYKCRTIKLGAAQPGLLNYVAYPAFDCRVSEHGSVMRFAKLSGSQRPMGQVFADGPARMIFLGTLMLGDETRPFDYGSDSARDMAGAVQRIGERRWRLILPYPRFESVIDVIELVPDH